MPLKIRFRHTSTVLLLHRGPRGGGVSESVFGSLPLKRFTETIKWRDPWFRRLTPLAKLLWFYLLDNCDHAGVIDLDLEAAAFDAGGRIEEKHLAELQSRFERLPSGKIWIHGFVKFQYGTLNRTCRPHLAVFKRLEFHGIHSDRVNIPYTKSSSTLKDQDQDQDQDKEGVRGEQNGCYHKDSRIALHWLNEKSGKHFRETDTNLGFISGRLSESGVSLDGIKQMIERQCRRWKGTSEAEWLRPETLFNKTKFDGYYAAKDQPVIHEHTHQQRNKRNEGVAGVGQDDYGAAAKRKVEQQVAQAENRQPSKAQRTGT